MDFDKFSDVLLTEMVSLARLKNKIENEFFLKLEFDHKVTHFAHNIIIPCVQ